MKMYKVKTRFTFDGYFKVPAKSKEEAKIIVNTECGGTNMNIQTTDENVNWNFPIHPEKKIINVMVLK